MTARCAVLLGITVLVSLLPYRCAAAFDPKALDQKINLDLREASMADAVGMIAGTSDIPIIAPSQPEQGIIMGISEQTVRDVLDALSKATDTTWSVQDDVIVFVKPPEPAVEQKTPPERTEALSPDGGMSEMIASLNSSQFYTVSGGYSLGYTDLSPYQQDILKSMFSASTVGVTDEGEVIKELPAPDQLTVSFATLPYLTVPDSTGKGTVPVRLDSTFYTYLKRNTK